MKQLLMENGDMKIIYKANEIGTVIEKPLKCVMCDSVAFFIAKETNEPLCERCFQNNLEARNKN